MAGDRGQQHRTTDRLAGQGRHGVAVDADVGRYASGDRRDRPFLLHVGHQLVGLGRRARAVQADVEVEGLSVEGRGGRQVGQAGSEHRRGAQCRDGQDRSHQGGADRYGGTALAPLEGVANPDQGTGGGAHSGQQRDGSRRAWHPGLTAATSPGHRYSRAEAEQQYDGQGDEAPEQERRGVEGEPRGGIGQSRLAHQGEVGQPVGQEEAGRHSGGRDGGGPGHDRKNELRAGDAERPQRGVGVLLHQRLTAEGLGQHDQPHEGGEPSQNPPAHSQGPDGGIDGSRGGVDVDNAHGTDLSSRSLEAWDIGGPVSQSHEVQVKEERPMLNGPSEGLARIEAVRRPVGGRKLAFRRLDADHLEGVSRTVGLDGLPVQGGAPLRG